jgi:hypothetical protein
MKDLERVLELMRGSSQRWQTLRLLGHEWRHLAIFRRAWEHYFDESPTSTPSTRSIGFTKPVSGLRALETTEKWRIWLSKPDKLRTDFQVGDDIVSAVMIGDHWWSWSPHGLRTNNGDPSSSHGVGPAEGLLEPSRHLASLELQSTGHATFRSRSAFVVTARPRREHELESDLTLHLFGTGADLYKLVVDSEVGILLRSEADFQGQPFRVIEVDEIGVNEPADDATFDPDQLRLRITAL